jgi:predicted dehydrogenase
VHIWVDVSNTAAGRPTETPPVPPGLHYDLWLGPAPHRPYSPEYIPKNWRNWWDFGGGTLEDFGCHHMDLSHWALSLRHPLSVETEGPPPDKEVTCPWLIARYEYPARGSQPPLKLTWYHGGKRPPFPECSKESWDSAGSYFIGEKGNLIASYGKHKLLPEKDFAGFIPPTPTIPDSIGHHKEWIEAIKNGGPTTCNFDYSGALTESVLLGNVAYRTGKKLLWDPVKLKATNCPEADEFIQHRYRKGWALGS